MSASPAPKPQKLASPMSLDINGMRGQIRENARIVFNLAFVDRKASPTQHPESPYDISLIIMVHSRKPAQSEVTHKAEVAWYTEHRTWEPFLTGASADTPEHALHNLLTASSSALGLFKDQGKLAKKPDDNFETLPDGGRMNTKPHTYPKPEPGPRGLSQLRSSPPSPSLGQQAAGLQTGAPRSREQSRARDRGNSDASSPSIKISCQDSYPHTPSAQEAARQHTEAYTQQYYDRLQYGGGAQ